MTGRFFSSRLPTPTISRRIKLAMISMSALLWWLNMKIAGRCFQRFSRPRIEINPISALAVSANREIEKLRESRREPLRHRAASPS